MKRERAYRFLISGGGTGGHIYPAIAIAEILQVLYPASQFLFVGAKGKMEMSIIPRAGFSIKGLWISGLSRKINLSTFIFPFQLLVSLLQSFKVIRRFKPDVVIGMGGFASGSLLWVAGMLKKPILIHEQNAYAGLTNKLLKNAACTICVAYKNMDRYFPSSKIVEVGNPIRNTIKLATSEKNKALSYFGLQQKTTLLLIGGSLGARTLNDSILSGLSRIASLKNIQFLWQCGSFYYDEMQRQMLKVKPSNVVITQYIDRMDYAYAIADVVISRAGALSIAELCYLEKTTVLVPSPNVAEDHQTKNASALSEINAAVVVEDKKAQECLLDTALELLQDELKRKKLSTQIATLAKPDAANKIAEEVMKLVP